MQINFDSTTYRVFLSTDSTTCYLCKQTGHIAKSCQYNSLEIQSQASNEIPDSSIVNTPENFPPPANLELVNSTNTKRPHSITSSENSNKVLINVNEKFATPHLPETDHKKFTNKTKAKIRNINHQRRSFLKNER